MGGCNGCGGGSAGGVLASTASSVPGSSPTPRYAVVVNEGTDDEATVEQDTYIDAIATLRATNGRLVTLDPAEVDGGAATTAAATANADASTTAPAADAGSTPQVAASEPPAPPSADATSTPEAAKPAAKKAPAKKAAATKKSASRK